MHTVLHHFFLHEQTIFDFGNPEELYSIQALFLQQNKSLQNKPQQQQCSLLENAVLTCFLEGNIAAVEVCFEEICFAAKKELEWNIALQDYQSQRLLVRAERNGEARYAYFDLHIVEIPNLRVENINLKEINFHEKEDME